MKDASKIYTKKDFQALKKFLENVIQKQEKQIQELKKELEEMKVYIESL